MNTKFTNQMQHVIRGSLIGVSLLAVAGSAGAATGNIVNGGSATLTSSTSTTNRITSVDSANFKLNTVTEIAGVTEVQFTVTPTNRTVWFEMTPTFGAPHEDFKFTIEASGTTFTDLWIDVWKPGGSVGAPYAPPVDTNPFFPQSDDKMWGVRTSFEGFGFGTAPQNTASFREMSLASAERETIRVDVDSANDTVAVLDSKKMKIDTTFEGSYFDYFADATWNNFNDFGSLDPTRPVWYLGLTVDGLNSLMDENDLAAIAGAPVPIPAAIWMFGSALLGLVTVGRRRMLNASRG